MAITFFFFMSLLFSGISQEPFEEIVFHGAADVSAAVFLDPNHFAVASDETNQIRIYSIENPERPAGAVDLSSFLRVDNQFPEADIEAAASAGGTIYWITSHGRNKDGKVRDSRYRFFACTLSKSEKGLPTVKPLGQPCSNLIEQFLAWPEAEFLNLDQAVRKNADLSKKEREKLAPKKKGLNIEALTVLPTQKSLLIGLRNPLYRSDNRNEPKAIAFELLNPEEVVQGQPARFGRIALWNLGGRGLRGMEYDPVRKIYYVLAGPVNEESSCALYIWDGDWQHSPQPAWEWERSDRFTPEGIALHPSSRTLWFFSDDGTLEKEVNSPAECREGELLPNGKCPNKFLIDALRKTFRVRIYPAS
jgi:hypothetical protein